MEGRGSRGACRLPGPAAGKGRGLLRTRCRRAGWGSGGGRGHGLIAVCALHSVPHLPPTACLAACSRCQRPAGTRPLRTAFSWSSRAWERAFCALRLEWAGGRGPRLALRRRRPGSRVQASRIPAGSHPGRRGSRAARARSGEREDGPAREI
jgi:hypothetical protein